MLKICKNGHITGYRSCGTCGTQEVGLVAVRVVATPKPRGGEFLAWPYSMGPDGQIQMYGKPQRQWIMDPPRRSRGPYTHTQRRKVRFTAGVRTR